MFQTKITKREARKLFDKGIDIGIGGHDVTGEGAMWRVSQFKQTTFDELCSYFENRYCRGIGRLLRVEFFIIDEAVISAHKKEATT